MLSSGSNLGLGLFLFLLTINQYNCQGNTSEMERPGKNLCDLPIHSTVDCSNQIKSGSPNATCNMTVLNRDLPECSDSGFNGEKDGEEKFGSVNLSPYPNYYYKKAYPAFNITFTKIKWTRLRMRFVDKSNNEPRLCREFKVSGQIQPSAILSLDCLWSFKEGYTYIFQYVLTAPDDRRFLHSYLLRHPRESDVFYEHLTPENYIFMIMDETAFPNISLKLQVPASKFGISSTNVTLYYKQDKNSAAEALEKWLFNFSNKHEGDFINQFYDTHSREGFYYFNASFYSAPKCKGKCPESSTPALLIPGRDVYSIISIIVLITVPAVGVLWLLRMKTKRKKLIPVNPPNVLFVYDSSYPVQVENMYKMKQFFEENCYVASKLDLIEIPKSKAMNAYTWYYEAFKEANCVLVFVSPDDETQKGIHEDNVYHNLHFFATQILFQYMQEDIQFSVACIKLPGCSWNTLPLVLRIIDKKFSLPENLSKLLKFMKVAPVNNGSSLLVTALQQSRKHHLPETSLVHNVNPPSDDDESDDSEPRGPITVAGIPLNMSGDSTSVEEDEDEDFEDDCLQRPTLALKL